MLAAANAIKRVDPVGLTVLNQGAGPDFVPLQGAHNIDKAVVTQAFSQRRKTLRNNFKGTLEDGNFEALQIDPSARAETLSIDDFIAITVNLQN